MTSTNPVDLNDPHMKWIVALAEGFKRAGATHSPIEPDPQVIYDCIQGAIRNAKVQLKTLGPMPIFTTIPRGPTLGFRQCAVCKAGGHANCPGGEWVDPSDPSKGHYMCGCGCEAAT